MRRRQRRFARPLLERLEARCVPATLHVPETYTTIQAALAAAHDGDDVLVGPGTYSGPLEITARVNLRGAGRDRTIIKGTDGKKKPVLLVQGVAGNEVSDLTLRDGLNGGVVIVNASPVIRDTWIKWNLRETTGAGVDVTGNSNPVIIGNGIENNRHYQGVGHEGGFGGGIYYAGGDQGLIAWNDVEGNDAWAQGGGLYLTGSSPRVHGNVFQNNSADFNGGIFITGGSPQLENNLLVGNERDPYLTDVEGYAGIFVEGGSPVIRFNTLFQNGLHSILNGITVRPSATAEITGNIIARSSGSGIAAYGPVTLRRNDAWGNSNGNYSGSHGTPDPDSISADPRLDGHYAPLPGSPVLNAGPPEILDLDVTPSDMGYLGGRGTAAAGAYQVQTLVADGNIDHRILKDGFHFQTLREQPTGEVVFRSHPDHGDDNGWGSSEYWNVYVAGGPPRPGRVIDLIVTASGVYASAGGSVATGTGTAGTWLVEREVSYDAQNQTVQSEGTFEVTLSTTLRQAGGDLNVGYIASNRLVDVPLQTGGRGNTGDTRQAVADYGPGTTAHAWSPEQGNDFPIERTATLTTNVTGEANVVDGIALGVHSIAAARKPGLTRALTTPLGPVLAFGATYAEAKAQDPFADNVGVLALVPQDATDETQLLFWTQSQAVPGPPIAYGETYTTDEDVPLTADAPAGVLHNDLAAFPAQLRAVLAAGPHHGTVDLKPDGAFAYKPDAHYFGTDSFSYRADDGGPLESPSATVTILVRQATLRVASFAPTASGFIITFTQPVDTGVLNLYDSPINGRLGAADLTVVGPAGPVPGTIVIDPGTATTLRWVRLERTAAGALDPTGSVLPDGTYTVILLSAANAFKGSDGYLLDGDGDRVPGGDYTATFTQAAPATIPAGTVAPGEADAVTFDRTARVVSLRQFARGPGQTVNLPNPSSAGLPVTLSDGSNVRAVDLTVRFNPALLQLSAATTALANFSVTSTIDNTQGVATFSVRGTASAPAGAVTLLNIPATVPGGNAAGIYLDKEVLDVDLSALSIGDGSGHAFPKEDGDGVHAVIFLGDVTGNGEINAADAAQVAVNGAYSPYGFAGTPLLDPLLVGDVTDNGQINGADASEVAKRAAALNPAFIPNYTPLTSAPTGIDPKVYVLPNTSATPGAAVSVPVLVDTLGQGLMGSSAVTGFRLALTYDPAVLSYTGIGIGDLMSSAGTSWAATVNDSVAGQLVIVGFETSGNPVAFRSGVDTIESLVRLNFTAAAGASGSTVLNLANQVQVRTTQLNGVGNVLLALAPTPNDGGDPDDGLVNFPQPRNRPPLDAVPPASALPPVNPPHALTFSGSTAVVVSDPDAGTSPVWTTVSVGHGTLTLSGSAGLGVVANGSATVTLTGAMSDINKALNGLRYVPSAGFSGTDTLTASTNDLGRSGAGGPQTDSHSTTITVVGRPGGLVPGTVGGLVGAATPAPYSGPVTGGAVPGGGTASASKGPVPASPGDEFWRLYGAAPNPRPVDRPGDLGSPDYDLGGAVDALDPTQFLSRPGMTSRT